MPHIFFPLKKVAKAKDYFYYSSMKVHDTKLQGVLIIEPRVFSDNRGVFFESWNQNRYRDLGLPSNFVQDNISISQKGVLRGLHFQQPKGQGKLVQVLEGEIFDVAVDLRVGSPTFKQWIGVNLSAKNHHQLWIPEGFAHGFCVMGDRAMVSYKTSEFYYPENEVTVLWNDPELRIDWPISSATLSSKDLKGLALSEIPQNKLPTFFTQ